MKQALDLCLSCKACKSECPANVDIATYKAEFLSHYYEGKRRPLAGVCLWHDRSLGRLGVARAGAGELSDPRAGSACNLTGEVPGPGAAAANSAARFAELPPVGAGRTRVPVSAGKKTSGAAGQAGAGQEVVLWVDTFNNYFHPETSHAAVAVLQQAGFHVSLNPPGLCCGRPLYDFGMIAEAKEYLAAHHERLRRRAGPARRGARAELRVRLSRRAAQLVSGGPARHAPRAARRFFSANFSSSTRPATGLRRFLLGCCSTGTAIRKRS